MTIIIVEVGVECVLLINLSQINSTGEQLVFLYAGLHLSMRLAI
jgi:hypothetical protein